MNEKILDILKQTLNEISSSEFQKLEKENSLLIELSVQGELLKYINQDLDFFKQLNSPYYYVLQRRQNEIVEKIKKIKEKHRLLNSN